MPTIKKTKVEYEGRIEEREVIVEEEHISPWERDMEMRLVGKPTPRVDGVARVTGQALYTHDVRLPGMLIGKFLRSPYPHARIQSIDVTKAEAIDGVYGVWHHKKQPAVTHFSGKPIFPEELVYEGDEVAFVVARDQSTVEDALDAIEVTYEELPFAWDFDSATQQNAPPVFVGENDNLVTQDPDVYERGNISQGIREADVVVEMEFTTPTAAHCSMETHSTVASWVGDQLTMWHSTQGVFATRANTADAMDMPLEKVRAISEFMGGGFGAKQGGMEAYTMMAIQAARELGHPVRVVLDREEEQLVSGYRPPSRQRVRLGAKKDGTLTAIEHESWETTGAYGGSGYIIEGPAKDLYACPNVRTARWAARSNRDHARAFRAPGYVEGAYGLECAMDALADKLEMDPLDLRLKNYTEESPQRDEPYTYKGLRKAYEMGAERFGWQNRELGQRRDGPWRRGWGMASQIWGGGGGPPANAIVKLFGDGTAEVAVGVQDIGTGTRTALAMVAAEELGLPLDRVRLVLGDTLPTAYGPTSGGSVTLASASPAVRSGCREALRQLFELAAVMMDLEDAGADDFAVEDGEIVYTPDPAKRISYTRVSAKMGDYTIVAKGARGPNPENKTINTFGAHFVQVAVNIETGQIRVERVVAAHDIGRVINPKTADSQVYGGVIQGLGYALTEERVIDPDLGLQLTPNLEDYKVPVITDIPEIEVVFVDVADTEANSVGSKGLGEPPIIPVAPAIANAVFDAIGVRLTDLPMTPNRVLAHLPGAK